MLPCSLAEDSCKFLVSRSKDNSKILSYDVFKCFFIRSRDKKDFQRPQTILKDKKYGLWLRLNKSKTLGPSPKPSLCIGRVASLCKLTDRKFSVLILGHFSNAAKEPPRKSLALIGQAAITCARTIRPEILGSNSRLLVSRL